jgi:hypothetical protein
MASICAGRIFAQTKLKVRGPKRNLSWLRRRTLALNARYCGQRGILYTEGSQRKMDSALDSGNWYRGLDSHWAPGTAGHSWIIICMWEPL